MLHSQFSHWSKQDFYKMIKRILFYLPCKICPIIHSLTNTTRTTAPTPCTLKTEQGEFVVPNKRKVYNLLKIQKMYLKFSSHKKNT